jgi:hypothetical protein
MEDNHEYNNYSDSSSEPDGCLAVPEGYSGSVEGQNWFFNESGVALFAYDERGEEEGCPVFRGVKVLTPILLSRVNTQIINGLNVFVNLDQKILYNRHNVAKVILTEECAIFEITENDTDWEVNMSTFQRIV